MIPEFKSICPYLNAQAESADPKPSISQIRQIDGILRTLHQHAALDVATRMLADKVFSKDFAKLWLRQLQSALKQEKARAMR